MNLLFELQWWLGIELRFSTQESNSDDKVVRGGTQVKPSDIPLPRNICSLPFYRKLYGFQTKMPLLNIPSITNKSGIIRLELGISLRTAIAFLQLFLQVLVRGELLINKLVLGVQMTWKLTSKDKLCRWKIALFCGYCLKYTQYETEFNMYFNTAISTAIMTGLLHIIYKIIIFPLLESILKEN